MTIDGIDWNEIPDIGSGGHDTGTKSCKLIFLKIDIFQNGLEL